MAKSRFVLGEWNVLCDRCGVQFKASQLRDEWTGLKTCSECWEPRHPSDLARIPRTEKAPPWTRPEGTDTEVSVNYVSASVGVQS